MNVDSEQITLDKSVVIAADQPLASKELQACVISALGEGKCKIVKLPEHKWVLQYANKGVVYNLLVKSCTYLGNPHPIYKKRIQLPRWFNEYASTISETNPGIDVRYIGVYHYGDADHGDNVIFIDFKKDTFLLKKGNNSSAHVYTNDLYQAMTYGIFTKVDRFGNTLSVVRKDKFAEYINGENTGTKSLLDLFREFNCGFTFGQWLKALDVIKEMHQNDWNKWKETEWAGFFLEYKFNKFTNDYNVTDRMRFVGSALKRQGDLDFDIRFDKDDFFGDLKASDIKKKLTPGNDKSNLIECINKYDKFWYIIYEHDTIKDSVETDYEATKGRNHYIKSVDPSYNKGEMSYCTRMKNKVKFVKMTIIELNRINFRDALMDFNQGRQQDGKIRKPKFNIDKKVLENDNYVIFRYVHNQ